MDCLEALAFGTCIALVAFVLGASADRRYQENNYKEELQAQGSVIVKLDEIRLECVEK